ncbi:hypothetical protein [Streptomyces sp. NPDC127108]|uniref:hypothetical protein n=1 Tax=Streptomyces sp. NPDC127108 TaxID=3345361 RepID=UPI003625A6F0
MLRHEFQPGRLVAGFFLAVAGLVYAGDAGGLWDTPWFAMIPIVVGGLFLAAATAAVAHGIRKARRPRAQDPGSPTAGPSPERPKNRTSDGASDRP